jgi:hypothetical protein
MVTALNRLCPIMRCDSGRSHRKRENEREREREREREQLQKPRSFSLAVPDPKI